MRDLSIHIGLHRTGTTYLQHHVFPRIEGATYVEQGAQTDWVNRIIYEPGASWNAGARRVQLIQLVGEGPAPIISSERLSGTPFDFYADQERIAARLAAVAPEARILLTIRRQDTLIASLYKLYVMAGGTYTLSRFVGDLDDHFDEGYTAHQVPRQARVLLSMFHFDYIAGLYETLFPGRVSVVPYETIHAGARTYATAVCSAIGLPAPHDVPEERVNAGYGGRQITLARRLNPLFRSKLTPHGLIPERIPIVGTLHPRRYLQTPRAERLLGYAPVIDDGLAARILAQYSDSNRRLDAQWRLGLSAWEYYVPASQKSER